MSDKITSIKLEQSEGGRAILGQPMLFECMNKFVLSPAHECRLRGSLTYLLIIKYLSILLKFSRSI